jgi:hypothetical protein
MKTDKEFCLECQEPHTRMARKVLHGDNNAKNNVKNPDNDKEPKK